MPPRPEFITSAQLFGRIGVTGSRRAGQLRPSMRNQMKKIKIKTATLPTALPSKFYLAAAAIVLALLATPHIGHAQGLVRGAQEGSREGNRVAGPVGGVVGGAVGAGVGGAMGAVKGVFGINDRGYRCRGYYDRYDRFHCYR